MSCGGGASVPPPTFWSTPSKPRVESQEMPRTLFAPFILVLVLCGARPAMAQSPDSNDASPPSPWVAGGLELFLPTVGFAYAGDWARGIPPNLVRVGAVVGIVASDACDGEGDDTACAVLGLTLLASHVWAVVGAVGTARDRGTSTPSSGLLLSPGMDGSLAVGLSLPIGH